VIPSSLTSGALSDAVRRFVLAAAEHDEGFDVLQPSAFKMDCGALLYANLRNAPVPDDILKRVQARGLSAACGTHAGLAVLDYIIRRLVERRRLMLPPTDCVPRLKLWTGPDLAWEVGLSEDSAREAEAALVVWSCLYRRTPSWRGRSRLLYLERTPETFGPQWVAMPGMMLWEAIGGSDE
jgi:hypothetical protein